MKEFCSRVYYGLGEIKRDHDVTTQVYDAVLVKIYRPFARIMDGANNKTIGELDEVIDEICNNKM